MNRQRLIGLLIITLMSLGLYQCSEQGNANDLAKEGGEVIQLKITGMTCGGCALSAKSALSKVKNVHGVEIHLESGIGKVYIKKGKSVDTKDLVKAVEKAGYKAKIHS